jgi:hypothetical protein
MRSCIFTKHLQRILREELGVCEEKQGVGIIYFILTYQNPHMRTDCLKSL